MEFRDDSPQMVAQSGLVCYSAQAWTGFDAKQVQNNEAPDMNRPLSRQAQRFLLLLLPKVWARVLFDRSVAE